MKVIYVTNALTHYYNQVLNHLNKALGNELIVVAPRKVSSHVGDGVYQTKEKVEFTVHELEEKTKFHIYTYFVGFKELLIQERPDVVVISEIYILPFIIDLFLVLSMKRLGTKLLLQSIPFQIPTFNEARQNIGERNRILDKLPKTITKIIFAAHLERLVQFMFLYIKKYIYTKPDGHLNYINDAYEIFESYGVSKKKIFITGNSPDTDLLFAIRNELALTGPILPPCEHRIIHVGRLVEWKRVDMLIHAFSRLKLKFPDAELLIAGYGPQEQALKNLSVELNLGDSVRFLGGIYDPRLLGQYLMASSVYVLAGMGGLSINDAMAFGLPIICSICDGTEKMLVREGYNGRYFQPGSEDDLVDKIAWMFMNHDSRKLMGENSTKIILNEVNIHTVIKGFTTAFFQVCQKD